MKVRVAFAAKLPMGLLSTDQTHKFNAYVSWDAIASSRHNLNISLLQSFLSGTPYSATQTFSTVPYVGDPADLGYLGTNLAAQTYYFSDRGAFRTDNVTRTDIAINYSFFVNIGGGQLEIFLQPEVTNLFNENGVIDGNINVLLGSVDTGQGTAAVKQYTLSVVPTRGGAVIRNTPGTQAMPLLTKPITKPG